MPKMLPSEELMNRENSEGKQENQECEIDAVLYLSPTSSPISSPPHFNSNLQNKRSPETESSNSFNHFLEKGVQELIISEPAKDKAVDETKDQKATRKRKLPAYDLYESKSMRHVFPRIEEKGKCPMSEFYELKPINVSTFSNFEKRGTSKNELKEEEEYDYDHDLAILKSIYHYYFNHGVIPYPYSKSFIDYIEASTPNLKFRGQALATKIVMLEHNFLTVMKMAAGYYPEIIHPVYRGIFYLSMGLWGNLGDYYLVENVDVIMRNTEQENEKSSETEKLLFSQSFNQFLKGENGNQEKLLAGVRKGKRPMSDLYELKPVVPTFSNFYQGAGTLENELKDDYDYDQDLAILKSVYHYCFNHGGVILYTISEELINYIEALFPNLKFRGQALATKILTLQHHFFNCLGNGWRVLP